MEATLGYFRLDVEPASNALLVRGGRVVGRARREGWLAGVDDGLGDPSLPGVFATAEEAKREAERVARYTLARRPDRERGTPGWAKGAMRPAARRR